MNESPATASLRSATPKKNVPYFSDFARDRFFLKWKGHFSLGFCPPSIRAVWRGFNADSVLPKLFFWGKGFGKTSADFPRGGGVWGGIRAGFAFEFFGDAKILF